MSIKKEYLITSADVMPNSTVKPSALFKYYQQIAGQHTDSMGLTLEKMLENKCVFVIIRMKNVFYSEIKDYDTIEIETASRSIKGAVFTRDYKVKSGDKLVAEASTQWALINIETRRLCRPSIYADYFPEPEELCSFSDPKKIVFETEPENEYNYKVVFSDIDENYHMNNTRYSDICLDAIGGTDEEISEILIDFVAEARLGEELSVKWQKCEGAYMFSAHNITTDKNCFNAVIKVK